MSESLNAWFWEGRLPSDALQEFGDYIPQGSRDDDGIWHDGPHRDRFDALCARVAELETLRKEQRNES